MAESTVTRMAIEHMSTTQDDQRKTKKRLIAELDELRAQLSALETLFNEQHEITNFSRPRSISSYPMSGSRSPLLAGRTEQLNLGKLALQRQRAYETARRQFDFMRALMESLGEGVYAVDHHGHFTHMNLAASAMLGWSTGELLGKDMHGKVHPSHSSTDDNPGIEACPLLDAWRDGRGVRGEGTFIRKDGTTFPVSYVSSPIISDSQIVGCVVAFHDITARKRLEDALRQRESDAVARAGELEAIIEAMNDAILVFNREGRIVHANSSAWLFFRPDTVSSGIDLLNKRMSRYAVRDEHGNPLANEDTPLFRILRGETLTSENSVDIFIRTPDGSQAEVNISGAPFRGDTGEIEGAVCIVRDVTERRQRERHTRETATAALHKAAELEAVLDAMTDVVLVYDQDGRVVGGNAAAGPFMARQDTFSQLDMDAWERASYYNVRDANNRPLPDAGNPTPLMRVLAGETIAGANAIRITFRGPDGTDQQVQISGAPIRDSRGHNCGAVMVFKTCH